MNPQPVGRIRPYANVMPDWLVQHQRAVNATAALAALVVIARTLLLAWPEYWPWMSEAGDLLYDLGIAWVTAWAFQFLVIVAPAERERKQFDALIAPRVDRLINLGMQTVLAMDKQLGKRPQVGFDFDGGNLRVFCETVNLRDTAAGWRGTWSTVLRHLGDRASHARAALRPFFPRLSPELLEALEQEELAMDAVLLMERIARAYDEPNMSRLEKPMFKWLTSIHMLSTLRSTSLAPERALPQLSAVYAATVMVPLDDFVRQREEFNKSLEPEQGPPA